MPVTGDETQAPTGDYEQAEAVATHTFYDGEWITTVAFNDRTVANEEDPEFVYPDGPSGQRRTVKHGASLLGWSYSTNEGSSFTYGGKILTPPGWALAWGDPAISSSWGTVYMAGLGASDTKWSGDIVDQGVLPWLDGWCAAMSTDGGKTFEETRCFKKGTCSNTGKSCTGAWGDCISVPRRPGEASVGVCNGDFYDGSSLLSWRDVTYFASMDVDRDEVHVWSAERGTLDFQPLPDYSPFDDHRMRLHPRLREYEGVLYVVANDAEGRVLVSTLNIAEGDREWSPPLQLGWTARADVPLADGRRLRLANPWSFDVGPTGDESFGDAELRVIATGIAEDKRLYMQVFRCPLPIRQLPDKPAGLAYCEASWNSDKGRQQWGGPEHDRSGSNFMPSLKVGGVPARWKATWLHHRAGTNLVSVQQANLAITSAGDALLAGIRLVDEQEPCTAEAPGEQSYWGDYNDLIELLPSSTNGELRPTWFASFTQNFDGCGFHGSWTADMHVGGAVFQ